MDEKVLKKRLQRMMGFAIGVGFALVMAGFVFVNMISSTLESATQENMQAETDEYVKRLNKQIDSDYQLLDTAATLISDSNLEMNDNFVTILDEANRDNDFLSMCYFSTSEQGFIVTLGHDPSWNVNLSDLNDEIQRVVQKSFQGENGLSNLFVGDYTQEKVFLYSVPVYKENQIVGALAATDHVEIFGDILDGEGVMGGTGRIHLLNSQGDFLIRSSDPINDHDVDSIFDPTYGELQFHKEEYQEAMEKQESLYFSFVYDSIPYRMYLAPVGINNWYMCSVNSVQQSNAFVYQIVEILAIFFLIVVGLVAFILFYGYRMVGKHNHQLFQLAYHDQLTGYYNFIYFQQLAKKRVSQHPDGCLACLNVRQFKFINEIFGRETADCFLKHMADQIASSLKKGEFFCRESADFFYLYLFDRDENVLQRRLQEILDKITNYEEISDQNYRIMMSCGAVISDQRKMVYSFDQMMTHVMYALDKAKETHQNTIWFFDAKLHEQEVMNNYIEGNMYQALENQEFKVYLQPKMDLETGKLAGAEALVRWQRSDGSIIVPGDFIPLFENNGFCAKLDLYMFEKVCGWIRSWLDQKIEPVEISINQTKRIFFDGRYLQDLQDILKRYQVPASLITLEILEGTALEDVDRFNERIRQLKSLGFHISMDDFGSGYSSLNTLSKLDIDELKIDRGFLMTVSNQRNSKEKVIMEIVIQLAKRLELRTVAEGVETQEDEALIRSLQCDYGQGYLYSRPLPAEDFTTLYLESREGKA